MLSLIEPIEGASKEVRPTVAILRRFSFRSYPNTEHADVADETMFIESKLEIEKDLGLSIEFAAMPEDKTHAVLDVENHCFRHANNTALAMADTRSALKEIGQAEQILLIAGLQVERSTADTRKACLQAIRRIRVNRPFLYAQFLCWERPISDETIQRTA